ncbi:MAG: tetratricopeptide repeat protein [Candidatus Promineifilaceae bacterium]
MSESITYQQAMVLVERAYRAQMRGEITNAIELYERSLEIFPTAEAHTYLGWAYSMMQRYDEAIEQCELAIIIDPAFGNPYNDIGAYLIEMGQENEAVPWLEEALTAARYDSPHFPLVNLGRVAESNGRYKQALAYYNQALEREPLYRSARLAKFTLLGKLN